MRAYACHLGYHLEDSPGIVNYDSLRVDALAVCIAARQSILPSD